MENIILVLKYAPPALVMLGLCVFVHELGHLLGGKLVGIKSKTFSLGFGTPIIKKKFGDTTYQIAVIPFGGYCSFYGDNPDDKREGKSYEFLTASPWRRLVTVIMGPLFNLFFGIILFFAMNLTGYYTETTKIIIPSAVRNSGLEVPALKAGLSDGDRILSIDGKPVYAFTDIQSSIALGDGKKINLQIDRNGERKNIEVTPTKTAQQSYYSVGIMPWGKRVLLADVVPDEVAAKSGLRELDEIKSADGIEVSSEDDFVAYIKKKGGQKISLDVIREGKNIKIEVTPRIRESFVLESIESDKFHIKEISIYDMDALRKAVSEKKIKLNDRAPSTYEEFKNGVTILSGYRAKVEIPEGVFYAKFKLVNEGYLGIYPVRSPDMDLVKFGLGQSVVKSVTDPGDFIVKNIRSLSMLFSGKINARENLSGPIMIAKIAGDTAFYRGIKSFVVLMAKISIILMIMNLLPIPAIDGSYVLFFLWEGITGKPISDRLMGYIQYAGFIIIVMLSIFAVFNDISKIAFFK